MPLAPLFLTLLVGFGTLALLLWRMGSHSRSVSVSGAEAGEVGRLTNRLRETEAQLTQARADLVAASVKLQTQETATMQFEQISQKTLKAVLGEARHESQNDLQKHAAQVAQTLEPLQNKLRDYDEAVQTMRRENQITYGGLRQQMQDLQKAEAGLHEQARALTSALSASPKVKGMYGEMMLRRLVEFVGMQSRCVYEEQIIQQISDGDSGDKRKIPDMVITLPGEQQVIVDAKAVMNAYVEAQQTDDVNQQMELMRKHCTNVRERVADLASKSYWENDRTGKTVEAVVLFLPAESLYAAAMQHDPDLIEFAMSHNVIVCGPNALLALLKVANQVWRRAAVEEEAQDIARIGNEVYQATCRFITHFAYVGDSIRKSADAYNKAVGTLEGTLLPNGRKFAAKNAIHTARSPLGSASACRAEVRFMRSAEARHEMVREHERVCRAEDGIENREGLGIF